MLDEQKEVVAAVDEQGMPVEERITSVFAARSLYDRFKEADYPAAKRRARLKGLIDGNPPYDPERLQELGLGYLTNVNFLEARSILDQKAGASFELLFEVPTLIEVKQVKYVNPNEPAPDYGKIIAEEFTKLCFRWSGFLANMDKARREADAYDVGLMLWRDEYDWRPRAFSRGSFLPEPDAEVDIETMGAFCVRDKFSIKELYDAALENEEMSKKAGWNPDAVKRLLINHYSGKGEDSTDRYQLSDWESVQQALRNGDWMTEVEDFSKVKVVHQCVREGDTGEVSHYIFPEDAVFSDEHEPMPKEEEFLFRKTRRFGAMGQVLWILPYNYGDGYLKSVRGLASSIEHHCDLSNRYMGRVFDAGFTTASLLLQPEGNMDLNSLQLIRMGVVTIIPPKLNTLQSTFQPQIAPLVQLRDLSVSIMRNNTGVWKQHPETFTERGPEKTARQVVEEVAKEARMEKVNVAFEYDQMERLYREMYRRATNRAYVRSSAAYPGKDEAKKFVDRCLERGVPEEVLFDNDAVEVYATRAIGMGSWGVKLDITNQLLNARALFDEQGQRNALRDWLAVRVGYQNVDRYAPVLNRDTITTNESSVADLENNDFIEGKPVAVGSDQTHALHIYRHIIPIAQTVRLVMESGVAQVDVQKALMLLSIGIPHTEEHLQYLAQDPARADLVKQTQQLLKTAVDTYQFLQKALEQQIKAAVKAQEAEQGVAEKAGEVVQQNSEHQVELAKIQKDYEIEKLKQESLNHMRLVKTEEQNRIRREQAERGMALQADVAARELEMKAAKQEAELDLERIKAQQKTSTE